MEFNNSINRALMLADSRLAANPNDTKALYAKGISYALRANYRYLVRKAWLDALRDAGEARRAHNRVTEIDPSFVDARLLQGIYDYMVGSMPFSWRMLGAVAGYHGDREKGLAAIKTVYEQGTDDRNGAAVMLCALYRRERKATQAVPLLTELIERFPRNYLMRLELVQMYGDLGEKDKALAIIEQVEQFKRTHAAGYDQLPEERIRYTRGDLLFWYNDLDTALADMKFVTARTDALDLNTGVYSWLRLGQIYDMKGQRNEAISAYRSTIQFAPGSDAAHLAEGYLNSRYKR
jgi:tetratricopeptide (TPR) repeat protein